MTPQSQRPPLDLGPLGGDPETLRARIDTLIRTFSALLDSEIKIVDSPQGGYTDCYQVIGLPLQDPELYLVAEHELSHWLFESDPHLLKAFIRLEVELLLRKAGLGYGTDEALPYQGHLEKIVHSIANLLEDHRCAGLWGELYAGGEDLLRKRWKSILEYEVPNQHAQQNLLVYFSKTMHGVPVDDAPDHFVACERAFKRATNLVEGVDAASCLGISSRLIEEIIEELLIAFPPPPPPQQQQQQAGGGGKGSPKSKGKKGKKRKGSPKNQKRAERLRGLQLLTKTVPRHGSASPGKNPQKGGIGADDVKPGAKQKRNTAGNKSRMTKVLRAKDDETDEEGKTPLEQLMSQGAEAMAGRIEEARRAMIKNQADEEECNAQIMLGWAQQSGIQQREVHPTRDLPPPSPAGYEAQRDLQRFRMKTKRLRSDEGDFEPEYLLQALGSGELDQPLHTETKRVAQFELLFLFDYSGSMFSGQALYMVERALADSIFAVQAIKCKAHMWAYSDSLSVFSRPGSLFAVPGMASGMTSMVQALDVARLWAQRRPAQRAILHVTDGWPTTCRAHNSTGNPINDLRNVLDEMRKKTPMSTIAIRHVGQTLEQARQMYDQAFGQGQYAMVSIMPEVERAVVEAVRILAMGHISQKRRR